jgi:hypothetical protein
MPPLPELCRRCGSRYSMIGTPSSISSPILPKQDDRDPRSEKKTAEVIGDATDTHRKSPAFNHFVQRKIR